ncbi:MAG: hypothetical protein IIC18_04935, partial [Bacteroidetes bacterium]|nr:hypothetical protein [Bacteroidota bacterium]
MSTSPPQTPSDFSVHSIVPAMRQRPVTIAVLAGLVLVSVLSAAFMLRQDDPVDQAELARRQAADEVAYSTALRQSPVYLGGELAAGALEQGDAVSYSDHLEDYYYFEAPDSNAFTIILTSAAFVPDLMVSTPDGRRLAASALMQTNHRAEVVGLAGSGRYEVTVTTRDTGSGSGMEVYSLIMDLDDRSGKVFSVDSPTSGATWVVTGFGFKPQYVGLGLTRVANEDSLEFGPLSGVIGISSNAGSGEETCHTWYNESGAPDTNTNNLFRSRVIDLRDDDVTTVIQDHSHLSFDTDG